MTSFLDSCALSDGWESEVSEEIVTMPDPTDEIEGTGETDGTLVSLADGRMGLNGQIMPVLILICSAAAFNFIQNY